MLAILATQSVSSYRWMAALADPAAARTRVTGEARLPVSSAPEVGPCKLLPDRSCFWLGLVITRVSLGKHLCERPRLICGQASWAQPGNVQADLQESWKPCLILTAFQVTQEAWPPYRLNRSFSGACTTCSNLPVPCRKATPRSEPNKMPPNSLLPSAGTL